MTYTIGEAAAAAGVTPRAVRLYEARGLLRSVDRSPAGYRLFDERHILAEADILNLELNVRAISTRSRELERVNVDNDEARLPDQIDREVSQGGGRVEGGSLLRAGQCNGHHGFRSNREICVVAKQKDWLEALQLGVPIE